MLDKLYTHRTPLHWTFVGHPQGRNVKPLSWDDFIKEDIGSRSQRNSLRSQAQDFCDAWALDCMKKSGKTPSSLSVWQFFYRVRRLARWMSGEGLWSFSKLEPKSIEEFMTHLVSKDGARIAGESSLKGYVALLRELWTCRRGVPKSIRFDPADLVASVAKRMVLKESTGWLPIEEKEALELLQDSIEWIENVSPDVAVLIDLLYSRRGEVLAKNKKDRTHILRGIYEDLAATENFKRVQNVLGDQCSNNAELVATAYRLTLGAGLHMIFGLVGMRSGEVECLTRQCGQEEGSSHEKQYRISSIESKRHRNRSWVTTEFAKPGIEALQAMFPWVTGPEERLLHVCSGNFPVPLLNRKTRPISHSAISARLKQFASSPHRGRVVSAPVHAHRWRHSFARFVMNRDKSALGALAEHFGHVWLWVTDGVYSSGRDKGMLAMLRQSQLEQMRAGFAKLLSAPIIAGKGSAQFENMRREVQQRSFQGKLTMEAMIEVHIKRGSLKLAPCSWGYCVYEQALSACKGTDARPNEVTRNPSLCADCSNFVVTPEHRTFWEDRCRKDAEFLVHPDLPEQSRAYAQSRMVVSEEILRKLLKNG